PSLSASRSNAASFASVSISSPLICSLSFAIAFSFQLLLGCYDRPAHEYFDHFSAVIGGSVRIAHPVGLGSSHLRLFTDRLIREQSSSKCSFTFRRSKRHRRASPPSDSYLSRRASLVAVGNENNCDTCYREIFGADGVLEVDSRGSFRQHWDFDPAEKLLRGDYGFKITVEELA